MAAPVRIVFLGGLGEIGRNCFCLEVDDRVLLVDCGLMFPEPDMPGVDLVLPDFTFLRDNADRIEAVVLTHGHEDHVGALSFLLREIAVPIYGTALTLGLARGRIEEAGLLDRTELIAVADGERRRIGPFDVEFIPVTHSVPHGVALAFFTPQGTIVHSGDFKVDMSPVDGRATDLGRLGELGRSGVRLALSDSTNSEDAGHTDSESTIGPIMHELFARHRDRRVIAACFASHLHRVEQIAQVAIDQGRVVAFLGRSMGQNVRLARSMGLLDLPDDRIIDIEEIDRFEPHQLCIISTGSQGEPLSALALMAAHENKWVKVNADDVVILSSHPIPGNEANVSRVIDGLHRAGADVVHTGLAPVHVSGHAAQEELKLFLHLVRPQWFVPVHGEYRHLVHHARVAASVGVDPGNILVCEDGDVVVLGDEGVDVERRSVPAGYLYVDGIVGDVGHGVLRDRRVLAEEGVVVVIVTVDISSREVVGDPEIVTKGWVYEPEAEQLLDDARAQVKAEIEGVLSGQVVLDTGGGPLGNDRAAVETGADGDAPGTTDLETLKRHARLVMGRFIRRATRRRPIVVPVIVEV